MSAQRAAILLIFVLMAQTFLASGLSIVVHAQSPQNFFVGVDVAYNNVTEIKNLIDQISSYSNLIIIGCTAITYNQSTLTDVCQYAYDRDMSFIIYTERPLSQQWLQNATALWSDHFLGLYAFDEPGGKQLDLYQYMPVPQADNYSDAASKFITTIGGSLSYVEGLGFSSSGNSANQPLFTSDYGLYWFDYKAGYNTVFTEFGWNYSRQLNVALCRGAATVQNKDWGVMITYTYSYPPYLESANQLLNDMKLAYNNGAKYIIVFDTNNGYNQDILSQDQLQAMKQFWQYAQNNPRQSSPESDESALVLPTNYGFGFRGPEDKIWGLWNADSLSYPFCVGLNNLLNEYGTKLDIIYDDGLQTGNNGYNQLISWNSILPQPTNQPGTSPQTSPTPSPNPQTTALPSPTAQPRTGFLGTTLSIEYGYAIIAAALFVILLAAVAFIPRRTQVALHKTRIFVSRNL